MAPPRRPRPLPAASLLCSLLFLGASSTRVNISNVEPRRDVTGELMDVHDGNVIQFEAGGKFYWLGMGYRNCTEKDGWIPPLQCPGIYSKFGGCGFREDHAVNLYSSPNLVDWTLEGDVLPDGGVRPAGIYFRPKIIRNNRTGEYVLWINRLPPASSPLSAYPHAMFLVFTAPAPTGPFKLVSNATTGASVKVSGGGDFTLFKEADDSAAYIAYDAWGNSHTVVIEQLTPDFHDSTGNGTGKLSPSSHEAPILFRRGAWYYLMYGHTCCFCKGGAGSSVKVAPHPLGPWTDTGVDINPVAGSMPWDSDHVIKAQENYVFQVPAPAAGAAAAGAAAAGAEPTYVYTGDLWSSAPDHMKSHDLQYWQPLVFNDSNTPPTIARLTKVDSFELDVP